MRLVEKILGIGDRLSHDDNHVGRFGVSKRADRMLQHTQNRLEQRHRKKHRRQELQSPLDKRLQEIQRRRESLGGSLANG